MKVALVHDYIKEFGGAERVLRVLADMYPDAPIYTAFVVPGSVAAKAFNDRTIIESPWAPLIKRWRLYSPLRFLLPWIWGSIDLSQYDLVITSTSGYVARGFSTKGGSASGRKTGPKVVAYCHTPPRFLYGFGTGMDWQKYWPVRVYGNLIGHYLRMWDYKSAQGITHWVVNSKNVQARVQKFYRKESVVIYPPVDVAEISKVAKMSDPTSPRASRGKGGFYLIAARLTGSKGIEEAIAAAQSLGIKLKIVGEQAGYTDFMKHGDSEVEFLGRVSDQKLWRLYFQAKGFIALARDEDFGMTVVEAQAAGTPVIAFDGGGFRESVIDKKTGILVKDTDVTTLKRALREFEKTKWNRAIIQRNARRFSRERFEEKLGRYIQEVVV